MSPGVPALKIDSSAYDQAGFMCVFQQIDAIDPIPSDALKLIQACDSAFDFRGLLEARAESSVLFRIGAFFDRKSVAEEQSAVVRDDDADSYPLRPGEN